MLQLKYGNEFLDLAPDQAAEMEKNSPLFLGLDTLLAEYSTPIAIKYSDKNARLLGFLFFDLTVKTKQNFEVDIYSNRTYITRGTLTIESAGMNSRFASKSYISGYVLTGISNFFTYIKDQFLTGLTLGGDRTYSYTTSDPTDASDGYWQHFQATWDFSDDYVILPARNQAFTEDDVLFSFSSGWMNKLDSSNNLITTQPVIPWPKVSYVLNQIFVENGWTLDTSNINDTDWQKLLMYSACIVRTNFYSVSGDTVTPTPFDAVAVNLKNAMPQNITCSKFILQLCKRFFWYPITDTATKTVYLFSLKDTGSRPAKDWTNYADPVSESDFSATNKIFAFKNTFEGEDQYSLQVDPKQYTIVQATGFEDPPNVGAEGSDLYDHYLYYVFLENKYYQAQWDGEVNAFVPMGDNIYDEEPENATDSFETSVTTMALQKVQFENGYYGYVPIVNQERGTNWGIRTVLYHGLVTQVDSSGEAVVPSYPYGSSINTPPSGTPQLAWSNVFKQTQYATIEGVLVTSEFGIIDYWAKPWLRLIASGEVIKRNFYLPLHELIKFQWNDIILINNIAYFIASYTEATNRPGFIAATLQRLSLDPAGYTGT